MRFGSYLDVAASGGHLALALLIARVAGPRVLRWALVALCLDMFGWNFAAFAFSVTGSPSWHRLDLALSPLTVPIGLHVILAFVGRLRRLRVWLRVTYVCGGTLSMVSVGALYSPAWARWSDSSPWAYTFLAILIPVVCAGTGALVSHFVKQVDKEERARTWLMLGAVVGGGTVGSSELLKDLIAGVPSMGALGSLLITLPTAIAFLRYGLFHNEHPWRVTLYITGLSLLLVVIYAIFSARLAGGLPAGVFAAFSVGIPLVAGLRRLVRNLMAQRERVRYLTRIGRMVEQMAHDLRNPAASLKAAIQYVQVEERRGLAPSTLSTYLEIMRRQVDRVADVIDGYLRVARVVPSFEEIDLNRMVTECAERHTERVRSELAAELPRINGDADLLAAAIDNVVTNALEASDRAPVLLRTSLRCQASGDVIEVAVEDRGSGMDARQVELAFEEFFTTKPAGSGLGLSFAERVLEAHGGTVLLTSAVGKGTTATLRIPVTNG
jgi:two-component system, NtrC family, sensor histidine kinase HydH